MIRDLGQLADAYQEGRWGLQRFIKTTQAANASTGGNWCDWSFTSGQPANNARTGSELEFTPYISTGNKGIYIPTAPTGMDTYLTGVTWFAPSTGSNTFATNLVLYDLVGVYPLISGDVTDPQTLINTEVFPRYANGEGLQLVLVNHVTASTASGGTHTLVFDDSDGVERTVTFTTIAGGLGAVASNPAGSTAAVNASPFMPIGTVKGVRRVKSIQFGVEPGGLWAIYVVRPLATIPTTTGVSGLTVNCMTHHCFCAENGFVLPKVEPGAWLGFLHMISIRQLTSCFGHITYVHG